MLNTCDVERLWKSCTNYGDATPTWNFAHYYDATRPEQRGMALGYLEQGKFLRWSLKDTADSTLLYGFDLRAVVRNAKTQDFGRSCMNELFNMFVFLCRYESFELKKDCRARQDHNAIAQKRNLDLHKFAHFDGFQKALNCSQFRRMKAQWLVTLNELTADAVDAVPPPEAAPQAAAPAAAPEPVAPVAPEPVAPPPEPPAPPPPEPMQEDKVENNDLFATPQPEAKEPDKTPRQSTEPTQSDDRVATPQQTPRPIPESEPAPSAAPPSNLQPRQSSERQPRRKSLPPADPAPPVQPADPATAFSKPSDALLKIKRDLETASKYARLNADLVFPPGKNEWIYSTTDISGAHVSEFTTVKIIMQIRREGNSAGMIDSYSYFSNRIGSLTKRFRSRKELDRFFMRLPA